MQGLARYFAERERQRADDVRVTWDALSPVQQKLVREAAVMGYVRGSMAGEVAAHKGAFRTEIPADTAIVAEVISACLSMDDLYPTIRRAHRRGLRRAGAS